LPIFSNFYHIEYVNFIALIIDFDIKFNNFLACGATAYLKCPPRFNDIKYRSRRFKSSASVFITKIHSFYFIKNSNQPHMTLRAKLADIIPMMSINIIIYATLL